MAEGNKLYSEVVAITEDYLGPAADRFVSRQVEARLSKTPKKLTRLDLDKLVDWLRLSLAFITSDQEMLDEYSARLEKLARQTNGYRGHANK